jgi:hypothetical protein
MTAYDRLMAEVIPIKPTNPARQPWTDADRDAHWDALCHAVGTPGTPRPGQTPERRRRPAA